MRRSPRAQPRLRWPALAGRAAALAAVLLCVGPLGLPWSGAHAAERPAPAPFVALGRVVRLTPGSEGAEHLVEIDVQIAVLTAGWLSLPLGPASLRVETLTLDGRPASWAMGPSGPVFLAKLGVGEHALSLRGAATGAPGSLQLSLGLTARSRLEVRGEDLDVTIDGAATPAGPGRWDLAPSEAL